MLTEIVWTPLVSSPTRDVLNNITTVFLLGQIWHWITQEGWYLIKQRNWIESTITTSADFFHLKFLVQNIKVKSVEKTIFYLIGYPINTTLWDIQAKCSVK